ncbi:hypothetical protein RAS1_39530 [Phycisphaerae bacterium RAS1]|nr:hypothetical protein RAS1_39530 [Phycisphaerae bacterium RAS1]
MAATLIDIPIRFEWFRARAVLIGIFLGCVIGLAVAALLIAASAWGPAGTATGLILVVGAIFALLALRHWNRRRRILEAVRSSSLDADAIAALFERLKRSEPQPTAGAILEGLVRRVPGGLAMRAAPQDRLAAVVPIDQTFEPAVLDESSDEFVALAPDLAAPSDAQHPAEKQWRRSVRRQARLGALAPLPVLGYFLIRTIVDALRQRRVTPELALWIAITGAHAFFFLFPSGIGSTSRLFVVPGGAVLRRSWYQRWRTGKASLRYLTADAALLCVVPVRKSQWTAVFADREGATAATITRNEAMFLLRAWLSPVAPPSTEHVEAYFDSTRSE